VPVDHDGNVDLRLAALIWSSLVLPHVGPGHAEVGQALCQ
jgi:hypothetical protein